MSDQPMFAGRMDLGRQGIKTQRLSAKAPVRHIDLALLLTTIGLTICGAYAVNSASQPRLRAIGSDPHFFLKRQLIYVALASIVFLVTLLFDYRQARALGPIVFGLNLLLLVVVLTPLGHSALGAQRWIDLGVLQVQPSELMKVILIGTLASLFIVESYPREGLVRVLFAMVITVVPAFLIFLQPDLGTVMVLFAIVFAMLLVSGTRIRWLLLVLVAGVMALGLALQVGVLKDYQVARLTAFLDSSSDPQRAGFNLAQSKIAIGSGGLTGKGSQASSQTNLAYVPQQHTDFIFTAIGEQRGFLGAIVVIGLFALLLWRSIRIAFVSKDLFGTMLASGIAAMFAFQVFVNIGMTVGIMPITGIPLPFVSYGGSSLITSYVAVGLLMNVHMRRFT
ncbi:MAG: rod shape-determining protein RodA [Actinomycetota bacterium]|nr:rod shape-determining protein RodA [Actinomycetota bacterium]